MALSDILLNSASGGLLGLVGNIATVLADTWRKKKEAEVQIQLLRAQTEAGEKAAAWDAFAKSQQTHAPFTVPHGVAPWAANIFTAVEAFRSFTRPGLTWALLGVLVYVFAASGELARSAMLNEITFGAFTALGWWFGSRYQKAGAK